MADHYMWRAYSSVPYDRYACTITYDPKAEEGYRVTDHEPSIADAQFFHSLADHMLLPQMVQEGIERDGAHVDEVYWVQPGSEVHFEAAVRSFPLTSLSWKGRPQ